MRFFITEEERKNSGSTDFIEFQKGAWDGDCWKIDSISIEGERFSELRLRRFFSMVLPQFDYYGITQVSKDEFEKLCETAKSFSADVDDCMKELGEWIGEGSEDEILFTICGM